MNFYANILENKGPVIGDPYFLQTEEEIKQWLKEMKIYDRKINEDLTVDVRVNVQLSYKKLSKIPVKFNKIDGYFDLTHNDLTSLKGCPEIVKGEFDCDENQLTSLEYCPKEVGGTFRCDDNKITSLEHCPQIIKVGFYCSNNELTSLKYCPKEIGTDFIFHHNKIKSLKYCPENIKGDFNCSHNELETLEYMPVWGNNCNFDNNPLKSLSFLSKFYSTVAENLAVYYPKLSWIPIKDVLKYTDWVGSYINIKKEEMRAIISNYTKIIKDSEIDDIGSYIEFLYGIIEEDKQKNITEFCKTILKDIEELQLY